MSPWSPEQLVGVVERLLEQSRESEWFEFKHNNADPQDIGEYISALANSAALVGQPSGLLIWGVDDETHEAIGTTFDPAEARVGREELENWLTHQLTPQVGFRFHDLEIAGKLHRDS